MPFSALFTPLCLPHLLTVPTASHARGCLTYCATDFSNTRRSTSLKCWHAPSGLFNCYLLRESFLHLICCIVLLRSPPQQPSFCFSLSCPTHHIQNYFIWWFTCLLSVTLTRIQLGYKGWFLSYLQYGTEIRIYTPFHICGQDSIRNQINGYLADYMLLLHLRKTWNRSSVGKR